MTLAQKELASRVCVRQVVGFHGFPKFENIFVKIFTIVGDFEIFSNCHRTLLNVWEVASFGIFEYLLKRRRMFFYCAVSSSERRQFANSDVLASTSISSIKFSAARIIFSAKNM